MEFFSLNLETKNLSITAFSRYFVDAKIPKIVKPSRIFWFRSWKLFVDYLNIQVLAQTPQEELVRNQRSLKCTKEPFLQKCVSFKVSCFWQTESKPQLLVPMYEALSPWSHNQLQSLELHRIDYCKLWSRLCSPWRAWKEWVLKRCLAAFSHRITYYPCIHSLKPLQAHSVSVYQASSIHPMSQTSQTQTTV